MICFYCLFILVRGVCNTEFSLISLMFYYFYLRGCEWHAFFKGGRVGRLEFVIHSGLI